jgi:hypothetical protein
MRCNYSNSRTTGSALDYGLAPIDAMSISIHNTQRIVCPCVKVPRGDCIYDRSGRGRVRSCKYGNSRTTGSALDYGLAPIDAMRI